MDGSEAAIQNFGPAPVTVSTAIVTVDKNNGTHRVALDKRIRGHPAYRLGGGVIVKVTLMNDGEIRIKKLADDYDVAGAPI